MDNGQPKTLAQMAAEAEAQGNAVRQWQCPKCGGQLWWVVDSRFIAKDGSRRRSRECRRCHHVIRTIEKVNSSTY